MKNNILIIDTLSNLNYLKDFFEELGNRDSRLLFLLDKKNNFVLTDKFERHNLIMPASSILYCRSFLLFSLFPVLFLFGFFYLLYFKYRKKINLLICVSCFEKTIFTLGAKLLGIKTVWLELPEKKNVKHKRLAKALYVLFSRFARLIVLSNFQEQKLLLMGIKSDLIKFMPIGIKLNYFQNQETIFNQIAETSHQNFLKKFFTIGTVVDLNEPQRIEILFQAIKKCLTVIHHLQLIVIGDGSERKNLAWLAKKMEIDSIVWFVGEQKNLRRWFDNMDIYLISSENFNLNDINSCLRAMAAELPILGPDNMGAEELISNNQNGVLVEAGSSELLAQAIIKLQQDKKKRIQLGQNARASVETKNNLVTMVDKFTKIVVIS
jgi:glycosyltransferase involved in cell wall biosynthesis